MTSQRRELTAEELMRRAEFDLALVRKDRLATQTRKRMQSTIALMDAALQKGDAYLASNRDDDANFGRWVALLRMYEQCCDALTGRTSYASGMAVAA